MVAEKQDNSAWSEKPGDHKLPESLGENVPGAVGTGRAVKTEMNPKAIALVVVEGGAAYEHEGKGACVRIVDLDNIKAGDPPAELPAGIGFEELCRKAELGEKEVRFVRYTIKAVKTFRGMEGQGYNANLYRDGRKVALVIDDASGGETRFEFVSRAEELAFEKHAEAQPPARFEGMTLAMDANLYADELVEQARMRKLCGKRAVFRDPETGDWCSLNVPYGPQAKAWLVEKYGKDVEILNEKED